MPGLFTVVFICRMRGQSVFTATPERWFTNTLLWVCAYIEILVVHALPKGQINSTVQNCTCLKFIHDTSSYMIKIKFNPILPSLSLSPPLSLSLSLSLSHSLSLSLPLTTPTFLLAPPLEEEPEDDGSDSSSDDEKGGTISKLSKYMYMHVCDCLTKDMTLYFMALNTWFCVGWRGSKKMLTLHTG